MSVLSISQTNNVVNCVFNYIKNAGWFSELKEVLVLLRSLRRQIR